MFRSAPVRLREALKMIGIAILIVELLFPTVMFATWAVLTYFISEPDGFDWVLSSSAVLLFVFFFALATSVLVAPIAAGLLVVGYGGWMVALLSGAFTSHVVFLMLLGIKDAPYDFGLIAMTSLPGLVFAGCLWYCAQLCRPE
jgi:hypothetical protein